MCHKKDTLREFVIPMYQINRTEPLLGPVKIPKLAADSERQIVLDKEDKSLQKHRQCRHPLSSSIETPFPCLYNCTVGSWQLYRQTATAKYSRQSSCTDREKSSQLLTTRGGGIYASQQYKDILYFLWCSRTKTRGKIRQMVITINIRNFYFKLHLYSLQH